MSDEKKQKTNSEKDLKTRTEQKTKREQKSKTKKEQNTGMQRILSGAIIFPLLCALLIFANSLVMDIALAIISALCFYEYTHCFQATKKANPSKWYGFAVSFLLIFVHMISWDLYEKLVVTLIPISLLVLMCEMLFNEDRKNIVDIAITFMGILYIPIMFSLLSVIRDKMDLGKYLVWYVFICSWGSDVFAYFFGKKFGKHKITKISPKKSVEGCIAGIVGAVILAIAYTLIVNSAYSLALNVGTVVLISAILAVVGQVGDVFASAVKRYCGIKDFGDIIPGHGGMLDRVDSVIFVIPFAYILLIILI